MFLHYTKEFNDDFAAWTNKDLTLSSTFCVDNTLKSVG